MWKIFSYYFWGVQLTAKNLCVIFQTWPWMIISAFLKRLPSPPRHEWCMGNAPWNLEGAAPQDQAPWPVMLFEYLCSLRPLHSWIALSEAFLRCFCWTLLVKPRQKKKKTTLKTSFPFWPTAQYFSSPGFSPSHSLWPPRPIKLQTYVRGSLHSETISMSVLSHLTPDCYTISWRKIKERRVCPRSRFSFLLIPS